MDVIIGKAELTILAAAKALLNELEDRVRPLGYFGEDDRLEAVRYGELAGRFHVAADTLSGALILHEVLTEELVPAELEPLELES